MAAKSPSDLGLEAIMTRKGEGRGVDPQHVVRTEPSLEDALGAVKAASGPALEGSYQSSALRLEIRQADPLGELVRLIQSPDGMRPKDDTPKKAVPFRLPNVLHDALKYMALMEGTNMQAIAVHSLARTVMEWQEDRRKRGVQ